MISDNKKTKKRRPKPARSYIQTATKAATHPVRSTILKALKDSPKSTVELEGVTGELRHNLYHHLNLLEEVDLVKWELKDNKTKVFSLKKPKRPEAAVLIFDKNDIDDKRELFEELFNILSKIEETRIPHKDKISKAEICLYFSWSDEG